MGEPTGNKGKLPSVDPQPAPASAAAVDAGEAHELTCAICLDTIALEELSIIKGCEHAYCSARPCWSRRSACFCPSDLLRAEAAPACAVTCPQHSMLDQGLQAVRALCLREQQVRRSPTPVGACRAHGMLLHAAQPWASAYTYGPAADVSCLWALTHGNWCGAGLSKPT